MSQGKEKLKEDLAILEAMAKNIESYLESEALFLPLPTYANMPDLSLGGYLMRQHRLLALRDDLLDSTERTKLNAIVSQFDEALVGKGIQFERKAHRELEARLRQWRAYLQEVAEEGEDSLAYYSTAVEPRVMIENIGEKLQNPPFQLKAPLPEQIDKLDQTLRRHWQSGPFVWPEAWQPAYPQADYWWLYGRPGSDF